MPGGLPRRAFLTTVFIPASVCTGLLDGLVNGGAGAHSARDLGVGFGWLIGIGTALWLIHAAVVLVVYRRAAPRSRSEVVLGSAMAGVLVALLSMLIPGEPSVAVLVTVLASAACLAFVRWVSFQDGGGARAA